MSREQDARVAELVMGFVRRPVRIQGSTNCRDCLLLPDAPDIDGQWSEAELWCYYSARAYTTDPAADYRVLEHVREKWGETRLCEMRDELQTTWARRAQELEKSASDLEDLQVYGCTQYRPGDYSRAALATIEKEQGDAN